MNRKKNSHPIEKNCKRILSNFQGGRFLVTLSGGADSVATLRAMLAAGADVEAANCNFQLRGEESERDSQFCRQLCKSLSVRLHSISFDTYKYMEENPGISTEMACRTLRHDYFDSLVEKCGFTRIATGHNADDNAETLFLNLLRGSGSRGLRGMPQDNGRIIRPLLQFHRSEILEYLAEIGQEFVTDSTNLESDYQRNFLRNEVFPMLRTRFAGFDAGVARTLNILSKEEKIISQSIQDALANHKKALPWYIINEYPEPSTLIFNFIRPCGGTTEIAEEIARSLPRPLKGKMWHTSKAIVSAEASALEITYWEDIKMPYTLDCEYYEINDENRAQMRKRIMEAPHTEIWVPYPAERYKLRPAETGERMKPLGMKGSRLCSDIISDAKLSQSEKCRQPVMVDTLSSEIIWIPGIKRSRLHLLDLENATEAYRITIDK